MAYRTDQIIRGDHHYFPAPQLALRWLRSREKTRQFYHREGTLIVESGGAMNCNTVFDIAAKRLAIEDSRFAIKFILGTRGEIGC